MHGQPDRIEQFKADIADLNISDPSASRDLLATRLGVAGMVVGVILGVYAYSLSYGGERRQPGPPAAGRDHRRPHRRVRGRDRRRPLPQGHRVVVPALLARAGPPRAASADRPRRRAARWRRAGRRRRDRLTYQATRHLLDAVDEVGAQPRGRGRPAPCPGCGGAAPRTSPCISARARLAPRQKCGPPPPKATCIVWGLCSRPHVEGVAGRRTRPRRGWPTCAT